MLMRMTNVQDESGWEMMGGTVIVSEGRKGNAEKEIKRICDMNNFEENCHKETEERRSNIMKS